MIQLGITAVAEARATGIAPNVATIAPEAAQFDVIDVPCSAVFEDADQLVLRSIKAAHAGVVLSPDTDVFEFSVVFLSDVEQIANMAPIDTDKVDGAVRTRSAKVRKCSA